MRLVERYVHGVDRSVVEYPMKRGSVRRFLMRKTRGPFAVDASLPKKSINTPCSPAFWSAKKPTASIIFKCPQCCPYCVFPLELILSSNAHDIRQIISIQ